MTTEHVSVPRELTAELKHLEKLLYSVGLDHWMKNVKAILSRATPSDVVPEHIGHPRSPGETRDEIEMFLRDAYAAGCNAALRNSLVVAMEYARREAPKLRAILKPSTQAVTDDLVERLKIAARALIRERVVYAEDIETLTDVVKVLESFATSLPHAAVPEGWRINADDSTGFIEICNPKGEYIHIGYCPQASTRASQMLRDLVVAMLAAAPQPEMKG